MRWLLLPESTRLRRLAPNEYFEDAILLTSSIGRGTGSSFIRAGIKHAPPGRIPLNFRETMHSRVLKTWHPPWCHHVRTRHRSTYTTPAGSATVQLETTAHVAIFRVTSGIIIIIFAARPQQVRHERAAATAERRPRPCERLKAQPGDLDPSPHAVARCACVCVHC